jgi:hypothetical protein
VPEELAFEQILGDGGALASRAPCRRGL